MDLAMAEAARLAGDPPLEIENLQRASAIRPRDVRAHYRLGLAYYRLRDYDRAAPALQTATRVSRDYAPAWYYLALAAERDYNFTLAAQAFAEATRLDPKNANFRKQQQRFTARFENS
jgi:tetratricopeptide (TPR) repeat protein